MGCAVSRAAVLYHEAGLKFPIFCGKIRKKQKNLKNFQKMRQKLEIYVSI